MPGQDYEPNINQDVYEDPEFASQNHVLHIDVDSDDDNEIEMEFESDESPEATELSAFDISNFTLISRFHKIITCLENILRAMRRCLITYPPESVVGSSLRSFNLNFLVSWRHIFEKINTFFESSADAIPNQKITSDIILKGIQNMSKEEPDWLENGISVVTGVKDRIDHILESVSSNSPDNQTARNMLTNLNDLILNHIALIPDGSDSYDIVKGFYEKLEMHMAENQL
ncbi:uncharacterized protein LOC135850067 [Planococcus citri]|uniref:uncharacterized protein LOC135850067 n=1 Tax=Planococcus citri TaxID=170843 RepID=UPI0031F821D9